MASGSAPATSSAQPNFFDSVPQANVNGLALNATGTPFFVNGYGGQPYFVEQVRGGSSNSSSNHTTLGQTHPVVGGVQINWKKIR